MDDLLGYGEERWVAVGPIGNRLHVCVYTDRGPEEDRVRRIISLRPADPHEAHTYVENRDA